MSGQHEVVGQTWCGQVWIRRGLASDGWVLREARRHFNQIGVVRFDDRLPPDAKVEDKEQFRCEHRGWEHHSHQM